MGQARSPGYSAKAWLMPEAVQRADSCAAMRLRMSQHTLLVHRSADPKLQSWLTVCAPAPHGVQIRLQWPPRCVGEGELTSPGLQVVAIDMRGYGESDRPKDRRAYDLSELTSDVSEVIKALGHQECALLSPEFQDISAACQQAWMAARS